MSEFDLSAEFFATKINLCNISRVSRKCVYETSVLTKPRGITVEQTTVQYPP